MTPLIEDSWKDASECFDCHVNFSILRRKHHCRNYGNVFCDRCTRQRICNDAGKLNRACDSCYSNEINPVLEEDFVSEDEALMSIFVSLGGFSWKNSSGWSGSSAAAKTKHGVVLNEDGCVKMLLLQSNELVGILPDNIQYLQHITKISLSNNGIYGSMCKGIGNLVFLVSLQLNGNKLTGRIPGFLGNCKSLQRLDLSKNLFYGAVPEEICSICSLMWLQLNDNDLTGIPDSIGKLSNIKLVALQNNSIHVIKSELVAKLPKDCTVVLDEPNECSVS